LNLWFHRIGSTGNQGMPHRMWKTGIQCPNTW
jgi:hypothetical protein